MNGRELTNLIFEMIIGEEENSVKYIEVQQGQKNLPDDVHGKGDRNVLRV